MFTNPYAGTKDALDKLQEERAVVFKAFQVCSSCRTIGHQRVALEFLRIASRRVRTPPGQEAIAGMRATLLRSIARKERDEAGPPFSGPPCLRLVGGKDA